MSNDRNRISQILEMLDREFKIKILEVNLFLGIEVKTHGTISLTNTKYINHVINKFKMTESAKSVTILADNYQNLIMFKQAEVRKCTMYREAIAYYF